MLNYVVLQGRIGNELVLNSTQSGKEVLTFSLAVNRNYKRDVTDWLSIVAWNETAKFISTYFKKGSLICIEGSIQTRSYTTQNNEKRYVTEIRAERVHFTGEAKQNEGNGNIQSNNADLNGFMPVDDSDLPF